MNTHSAAHFQVLLYGGPHHDQQMQASELGSLTVDGHAYGYTGKRVAPDGPYFFEHDPACCDADDLHLGERPPLVSA
jgi:hypothetical protein